MLGNSHCHAGDQLVVNADREALEIEAAEAAAIEEFITRFLDLVRSAGKGPGQQVA